MVCDESDTDAGHSSRSRGKAFIFISMTRFLREVITAALRCRDPEQRRVCAVAFLRDSGVHDAGGEVAAELC